MNPHVSPTQGELERLHDRLGSHFKTLKEGRGKQPVYMLEYQGSGIELCEISNAVRTALEAVRCTSTWWRTRYLPLLVLATEAGYEYQGPGRDFWDRFTQYSSRLFDAEERAGLSDLFRSAVHNVGAATPPDSPWTNQFCHIAWPITHAVLPKDLQRSLTRALADLPFAVGPDTPTERIASALTFAARDQLGVRFDQWLKDIELVGSLVHALLERTDNCWLERNLIRRIRVDIEQSPEADRQLQIAHARQDRIEREQGTKGPRGQISEVLVRWGTLILLSGSDGIFTVAARFPAWARELTPEIRKALNGQRYAPSLWDTASPVRIDRLLSAFPVELRLNHFPAPETATFPDLEAQRLPARIRRQLTSIQFELALPMAFAPSDDGYVQIRGKRLSSTTPVLIVIPLESEISAPDLPRKGTFCGLDCIEADPRSSDCQDWLRQLGFDLRGTATLRWVGTPPLAATGEPQFTTKDAVLVQADCATDSVVGISGSSDRVQVQNGDIVRIDALYGEVEVQLSSSVDEIALSGWIGSEVLSEPLCWVEWSGDKSTRALLSGDFSLRLRSDISLEDVPVHISVHAGTHTVSSVDGVVGSLPCTLAPHHSLWRSVLSDEARLRILSLPELTLRICLGSMWRCELHFEQELLPYWWSRDDTRAIALSEQGELPVERLACSEPLRRIAYDSDSAPTADISLLVPTHADSAPWGGICIGPEMLQLHWEGVPTPRLLRQSCDRDGEFGLEAVLRASLQWSLATSDNLAVEIRRRQVAAELESWVVETICGKLWSTVETSVVATACRTAAQALAAACESSTKRGPILGFDEYIELKPEELHVVTACFAKALHQSIPDLDTLLVSPSCLDDDAVLTALSNAFNSGYREYSTLAANSGQDPDGDRDFEADVWYSEEQWRPGFDDALRRLELTPLLDLVWPTAGHRELAELDYDAISEAALVDSLISWRRRHQVALQGQQWEPDEIRSALAIWIYPAAAVRTPWELSLPRMLVDRGMARAIRYASLRFRIAVGVEELRLEGHR